MITISPDIVQAFTRFLLSLILFAGIIILSFWKRLRVNKVLIVSALRGFVQLLILASVIAIVFSLKDFLFLLALLFVMVMFGAHTAAGRVSEIPGVLKVLMVSLFIGVFSVMLATLILGVLPVQAEYFIPIGGMVTGNSMNISYLTLDRMTGELKNRQGQIEAALCLGASPNQAFDHLDIIPISLRNAITPSMNTLKTLGMVTIPGLMSGMIIGGINPVAAAFYQVFIFFLIILGGLISAIIASYLALGHLFIPHDERLISLAN